MQSTRSSLLHTSEPTIQHCGDIQKSHSNCYAHQMHVVSSLRALNGALSHYFWFSLLDCHNLEYDLPSLQHQASLSSDLNTGSYIISLNPYAFKICTIILHGRSILTSDYHCVLQVLQNFSRQRCQSLC